MPVPRLTRATAHWSLIVATAVVIAGLASPEIAGAGTYEVKACDDAPGGSSNGWEVFQGNGGMAASKICPSNGDQRRGLYTRTTDTDVSGGEVSIRFEAPDDTRLRELRATLRINTKGAEPGTFGVGIQDDRRNLRFGCEAGRCTRNVPGNGPGGGRETISLDGAASVEVFTRCTASNDCSFSGSDNDIFAAVYGATVVIEDETAPELNAKGGSLAPGANPVQKGIADVVFDASDNTGIKSARLLVDGNEVDSDTYAYDETEPVPAENQSDRRLVIDTRRLSEGPHTAQLVVADSGGNEESYEKSIIVDNQADQSGDGGGGGDGDSRGDGGSNGGGGSGGGGGSNSNGSGSGPGIVGPPVGLDTVSLATSRRLVRNGRSVLFTGRVLDGGRPAGNALVADQAKVGRRWVTFKIVRTDALGNFTSRYRFKRTRRSTRYQFRAHVAAQGTLSTVDSLSRIVRVSP